MTRTRATSSHFAKARPLPLAAARWTRGFWADRFAECANVMVPAMGKLMTDEQRVKFIGNFEVAAGTIEGRHRGPRWNDGDFFKWLEAAAAVFAFTRDQSLAAQMDDLIDIVARAQREDGYLHTDIQIRQRAGEAVEPFDSPMDFEMYNMGHLISAAIVHHAATGKDNLLELAIKSAKFMDRVFVAPTPEMARHGICPSHLMALIELHRHTGDSTYRDLAVRLLNMRDLVVKGDDDNQDRIKFRDQRTAHGHAVRGTYLYASATDIYLETGDETLLPALHAIWDDLTGKKLYVTGGCGALFDGASPDGSADQLSITRVHQAFGRNYQLPQSTAHNETCAAIGNLLWNWRMFLMSGEAKYVDLLEHTLYNSVLAGISWDGTAFFYTNTLRQLNPMPVELRWNRHREKTLGCYCCPPNVVRTIAQSSQYAYAISDRGIYVNLFGGSELNATLADGARVRLVQESDYPWEFSTKLQIYCESPRDFSLFVRIPNWTSGVILTINGETVANQPAAGEFFELCRTWRNGDTIELQGPMPARLLEAHPLVEEARNHAAVQRGPIVYCLESVDLPGDVKLMDVHLPRNATFTPAPLAPPLAGIVSLQTRAAVRPTAPATTLYRELSHSPAREIDVRLVPYFAWDNRGAGEMTVWIPLT